MDQGQNVEPVNNQVVEKPKRQISVDIIAIVSFLASAIISLWGIAAFISGDGRNFIGPILLVLPVVGLFGMFVAFGLYNMKKWALYIFLVQLPIVFILGCFIFTFYFSYWFPFDLFLLIIIFITMFAYLLSIRKQFN